MPNGTAFKVTINDAGFKRGVRKLMDKFPGTLFNALQATTFFGLKKLKETTPRKTGKARRGWRFKKLGQLAFEIFNKVPYITALEDGSKSHDIVPKTAKALRWTKWPGHSLPEGKEAFFAKRVEHPGFRGYHMVANAQPLIRRKLQQEFTQQLRALINAAKTA